VDATSRARRVSASLGPIAYAVPAPVDHGALWRECFEQRYAGLAAAGRLWHAVGVQTRHAAVDPRVEDVSGWTTGARMRRYLDEAMPLATAAVTGALAAAAVDPAQVGMFAVVSCTGYATPGVDILVARDVGFPADVQRLVVGHMGCYAAIPALGAVADAVTARGMTAVLLCVELPSLHVQPSTRDAGQVVAHALFGDAATAVVLRPDIPGLRVLDVSARTAADHHDAMTWDVTDLGFRMGLSPRVPQVLAQHARPMVGALLTAHGLELGDVAAWAIHPGGPRILDVCADQLDLSPHDLSTSCGVLRDFGNCSSTTVLLVLDRIVRGGAVRDGDHVVALAFGPGLTLYAALLRVTS
jgi:predicted naringenin-chalcone synthase